jgi:FG-GAP repeat protein
MIRVIRLHLKASNTRQADSFGNSVALSADGNTLAVGAFLEDNNATGVNPAPGTNTETDSGAVYVFKRDATGWVQQAYVKASNTASGDTFGISLALSADGTTLAVGASGEGSDLTGVNPVGDNFNADVSGAAYVFALGTTGWTQQAYVKASNTGKGDQFGNRVALNADGNRLAVGALLEGSNGSGQNDNSAGSSGAVYVFERNAVVAAGLRQGPTSCHRRFFRQLPRIECGWQHACGGRVIRKQRYDGNRR